MNLPEYRESKPSFLSGLQFWITSEDLGHPGPDAAGYVYERG